MGNHFFNKYKFLIFGILILFGIWFLRYDISRVSAQDCPTTDYDCQIAQIQRDIDAISPAQQKNKLDLAALNSQIADLNSKITKLTSQLKALEKQILAREEDLAFTKEIFDEKAKEHYTFLRLYDPITPFLFSDTASQAFQEITLRQRAADADRKTMDAYVTDLSTLKTDKENLTKNKASLSSLQSQVAEKQKFLASEVAKVESYLAVLSSKQQEILNAKSGSFITSVGDVELADDYNASIKGFREAAPAGSFAVFSFGGYTHRAGMSQYGARGRANSGKSYDEILRAYYSFDGYEDKSGITIRVNNGKSVNSGSVIWTGSLDDYVKRIYEVPGSWPTASLQAQAIAARSYALAVTNNGANSICATTNCQVFKTTPKGGNWESAVNSTSGKVMISGGQPIKAYFSSTTGGYLTAKGWDTTDGSGGSNFMDKTYEKLGGSPWLYKAWYRQGYLSSGQTCGGHSDPWLNNEEFTDIINAAIVLKNGQDGRIVPVTTACSSGNPYSYSELRDKGGVTSVSSVSVSQGNGVTTNVTINGSVSLTGQEFKQAFNLRAPGYIKIPQGEDFGGFTEFAFFNIEKK
jgi:peptidoglycan hydrolase CwlO-like protein